MNNSFFNYPMLPSELGSLIEKNIEEICKTILEEMLELTQSHYGFFGFIEENGAVLKIYAWSSNVEKDCQLSKNNVQFSIVESGIWAEAIRQKKTFILNDEKAFEKINKRILPGHVNIKRFIATPSIYKDKVISLVALANKETHYDKTDEKIILYLLNNLHIIIETKRLYELTKKKGTQLDSMLKGAEIAMNLDEDFDIIAKDIYELAKKAIGADCGFVATIEENEEEHKIILMDEGNLDCKIENESNTIQIRGLREEAYKSGEVQIDNDFKHSKHIEILPSGHVPVENIILVPLKLQDKALGLIAFGNKPGGFTEKDKRVVEMFAYYVSFSLFRITEENRLKKSRERWRNVFEAIDDPMFIVNREREIVVVNESFKEVFGEFKPDDKCYKIVHHTEMPPDFCKSCDMFNDNSPSPIKIKNLEINGRWYTMRVFPIKDDKDGNDINLLHVLQDITTEYELESQKKESANLEAIAQLAGGVAHDINNRLAEISGFVDLIDKHSDLPRIDEYVSRIKYSITKTESLIEQLVAFSQKGKFKNEEIDIHSLIKEVKTLFEYRYQDQSRLKINLKAKNSYISCNSSQILDGILNLLINAVEAGGDRGEVKLKTKNVILDNKFNKIKHPDKQKGSEFLHISVIDYGEGMDKTVKNKIFEPFFTTKNNQDNIGMGLPAVFGIVKAHNGKIKVKTTIDKGTKVSLFFPIIKKSKKIKKNEKRVEVIESEPQKNIMIIDDEETIRFLLEEMVIEAGHKPVAFEDGRDAIKYYRENLGKVSLVILDMVMPKITGPEVFRELKKIDPDVQVLIGSGWALDEDAQEMLNNGALDFMQKPYAFGKFKEKLNFLLRV